MVEPLLPLGDGHTALSEEETAGLLPTYITTRGDLNEAEQLNIIRSRMSPNPSATELLDDLYLRRLHGRMFGEVWRWAGEYRHSDTNIGIAWPQIPVAVRELTENTRLQVTYAPTRETVARFHHRLVQIHPFPNGNGRHGREAARYLSLALGLQEPTWGAASGLGPDELRRRYVAALVQGDRGELNDLEAFMWS